MSDMNLNSPEGVVEAVRELFTDPEPDLRKRLYKELVLNALKCKRDALGILDLKVASRSMAEFRYAARVFKPYREHRKVSIFGSARTPEDDPYYKMAVEFARQLSDEGFMVITGAADGIMKAGNVGAGAENSFGVNIQLPFEQAANEIVDDDPKLITFKYFFTRKLFFLMEAHAVALFPGGFGTHDEGFETLTLVQTGKAPPMPFMLMELPGGDYWENYDRFIREQLLARELISPEDLSLYKIIRSPEEGVAWVKSFYSTYHSMRLVRDKLVIRLERELSDEAVEVLNDSFSDIVKSGRIHKSSAFDEERNEPGLRDKYRLALAYTQHGPSRLHEMILEINRLGAAG